MFTEVGRPLQRVELPDPVALPGEVVLRVRASGLCHTDVGILDEPEWSHIVRTPPVILGHEVAGLVHSVGSGVDLWAPGDRVAICPSSRTMPGLGRHGGYATFTTARQQDLVRIPDDLPFEQAAAGTDSGMTAYHAVMTSGQVKAGMRVGIIGLGGLGQVGARVAVLAGAEVFAADVSERARSMAADIGILGVVSQAEQLAEFDPEVIIDFAGFGSTTSAALEAVARHGRVVVVGMGAFRSTINTRVLIAKSAQIVGSSGGTIQDIESVYSLILEGGLNPALSTTTLEDVPEGLNQLRRGEVVGRLVAVLSD